MQLQVTLKFSREELTRLLKVALAGRGGAALDNVTVNGSEDGTVSGYAYVRGNGKTLSVSLSHEVIEACVMEASAAEGKPIEPGSLKFTYYPGRGFGGGPSVSAEAKPAAKPIACEPVTAPAGKVSFPGTCTVFFGPGEFTELLKSAARKSGLEPTYASVSFNEKDSTASASISVKGGSVALNADEVKEALAEILADRGYTVVPGGFQYSYQNASFGGSGGTSVKVTVTGVPNCI